MVYLNLAGQRIGNVSKINFIFIKKPLKLLSGFFINYFTLKFYSEILKSVLTPSLKATIKDCV